MAAMSPVGANVVQIAEVVAKAAEAEEITDVTLVKEWASSLQRPVPQAESFREDREELGWRGAECQSNPRR